MEPIIPDELVGMLAEDVAYKIWNIPDGDEHLELPRRMECITTPKSGLDIVINTIVSTCRSCKKSFVRFNSQIIVCEDCVRKVHGNFLSYAYDRIVNHCKECGETYETLFGRDNHICKYDYTRVCECGEKHLEGQHCVPCQRKRFESYGVVKQQATGYLVISCYECGKHHYYPYNIPLIDCPTTDSTIKRECGGTTYYSCNKCGRQCSNASCPQCKIALRVNHMNSTWSNPRRNGKMMEATCSICKTTISSENTEVFYLMHRDCMTESNVKLGIRDFFDVGDQAVMLRRHMRTVTNKEHLDVIDAAKAELDRLYKNAPDLIRAQQEETNEEFQSKYAKIKQAFVAKKITKEEAAAEAAYLRLSMFLFRKGTIVDPEEYYNDLLRTETDAATRKYIATRRSMYRTSLAKGKPCPVISPDAKKQMIDFQKAYEELVSHQRQLIRKAKESMQSEPVEKPNKKVILPATRENALVLAELQEEHRLNQEKIKTEKESILNQKALILAKEWMEEDGYVWIEPPSASFELWSKSEIDALSRQKRYLEQTTRFYKSSKISQEKRLLRREEKRQNERKR